jgi:hypothetical protein
VIPTHLRIFRARDRGEGDESACDDGGGLDDGGVAPPALVASRELDGEPSGLRTEGF